MLSAVATVTALPLRSVAYANSPIAPLTTRILSHGLTTCLALECLVRLSTPLFNEARTHADC
jgi:hypothetical protein